MTKQETPAQAEMDFTVTLPGGEAIPGKAPIVVVGPNGSGKTRNTRNIQASVTIDYVNALRNTRVAPELPAMGVDTARNNFKSQKDQAKNSHWELTNEFDSMLSQLLAQKSMAAIEFTRRFEEDPKTAGKPQVTPLTQVEQVWGRIFPGRELHWRDWKPLVKNHISGQEAEYSGNTMSDGEKAALFLAGRVFSADPGILVIDEPETHFHSLLAVKLWDELERARPDIRFVYVTHDLTFAMSRRGATFVLANPKTGLKSVQVDTSLPGDVSSALVGSASLSFYSSRIVFCEGETTSLDYNLYSTWFNGSDTAVRCVGSCQKVMRCAEAMGSSDITTSLEAVGVIDKDYHPDAFIAALPAHIFPLKVHEIESLFCLPDVLSAVCNHVSRQFKPEEYAKAISDSVNDNQRHQIIIERWKNRMEPNLTGLLASVSKRNKSVDELTKELPDVFDHSKWSFSPEGFLLEDKKLVEGILPGTDIDQMLSIMPGKQALPIAAKIAGMSLEAYTDLIIDSLRDDNPSLKTLGASIEAALAPHLPKRSVRVSG